METINSQELEKIVTILSEKKIKTDVIKITCKVNSLSELTKQQYNYLLYLLCLVGSNNV